MKVINVKFDVLFKLVEIENAFDVVVEFNGEPAIAITPNPDDKKKWIGCMITEDKMEGRTYEGWLDVFKTNRFLALMELCRQVDTNAFQQILVRIGLMLMLMEYLVDVNSNDSKLIIDRTYKAIDSDYWAVLCNAHKIIFNSEYELPGSCRTEIINRH